MEIKYKFESTIDDDLQKKMLAKLKEGVHDFVEPERELERKRVAARLAAKSRL